jgi:hypothetical protein
VGRKVSLTSNVLVGIGEGTFIYMKPFHCLFHYCTYGYSLHTFSRMTSSTGVALELGTAALIFDVVAAVAMNRRRGIRLSSGVRGSSIADFLTSSSLGKEALV